VAKGLNGASHAAVSPLAPTPSGAPPAAKNRAVTATTYGSQDLDCKIWAEKSGRIATMPIGTILIIVIVILLLGGFSGRLGGYGYGYGHGGMSVLGVVLVVLVVLLILGMI
jgi:hypothetical protein